MSRTQSDEAPAPSGLSIAANLPTLQELPKLSEAAARMSDCWQRIGVAETAYHRATLGDRLKIGVALMAAQERHAIPEKTNGKSRKVLRVEPGGDALHPQGFLQWIADNAPWLPIATAYKYMDAARGAGLTAWHAPEAVDRLVESVLADATLAGLITQGKKMLPAPKGEENGGGDGGPNYGQMSFDSVSGFWAQTEQVIALKPRMSEKTYQHACAAAYRALRELTGQAWAPADEDVAEYQALIEEMKRGGL